MTWGAVGGAAITAVGGYLSSRKQKKGGTTTQNEIPGWLQGASQDAVSRGQAIADRPYTSFSGSRVAQRGTNELLAGEMAQQFSARTANQMRGFQPQNLSPFENPYIDRVLGQRRRVIGEEYGRQAANLAARQTAADAFRSGRSDLARARLDESRMRALDDAEAETRAGAFDRAMDSYFRNEQQLQGAFDRSQQALGTTGALERNIRQAEKDFDYGQFLERRDWSVQNLTPLLQAISAARSGTSSTTTMQPGSKDYWGAAAGLLGQAVSTLGRRDSVSKNDTGSAAADTFNRSIAISNAFGP